ncbi:MAG: glutamyl-tRNA reductase [Nitrospinae bacterium]|nr:glutamyl-tRNA reductase [Nitrospinota bacterium]
MNLVVLGLNHNTAPVEVREKLSVSGQGLKDQLLMIKERAPEVREEVILSTCNRVEIYALVGDIKHGVESLKKFLCDYHEIDLESLEKSTYIYALEEAVEHLFKVSSSLDSMVIGEPQILGQVKDAYKEARELAVTGSILNNLFERSFSVAKRVRTETAIAENAVSISYAAVELARKIFSDISGKTVLLIGAGEMIELACKHLIAQGVKTVLVSNRTYDRAVELAKRFNGEAVLFDDLHEELRRCDIVISSTGAPHFVVRKDLATKVISERHNRPMFFIDIAVPRDIEPSVNEIDNCYVYDIDDLKSVVDSNLAERAKEARKAEDIVKKEVGQFMTWLDHLEVAPTIIALREKMEKIRRNELDRTLNRLPSLTPEERDTLEKMTQAMVNKMLHTPVVNLKKRAETEDGYKHLGALRDLFEIGE